MLEKKELYSYQKKDIEKIFDKIEVSAYNYHLLYQLPTGGGKTVIFSEIARRYIEQYHKKVLVLTHRIELCKQTSRMLHTFGVHNKIINSTIKELPDQNEYSCFVAMIETLKNRLNDEKVAIDNIGLVIIDEAHYNSFRKLFYAFKNSFILGVTATPLSSNIKLPMYQNYNELIVGDTIQNLIDKGYLAKATTYSYNVGLSSLKIGINGDYTVKSSDELYSNLYMQEKLLQAYAIHSLQKKTLIFNNGIQTSLHVLDTFKNAGYNIRHLDNTTPADERKEIIQWFKKTPNAILTSVGILTTGFDEPTVETIIINRATKSLTLYFQMIGRGSRKLPNKKEFSIIDLGNNALRFGLWNEPVNWQHIFSSPEYYLENLRSDTEIENTFRYVMPDELRIKFANSQSIDFDVETAFKETLRTNKKAKTVLEISILQHAQMCLDNTTDLLEAKKLSKELLDDITYRVKIYCNCLGNVTKNYRTWLVEDYVNQLNATISKLYRIKVMEEAD